MATYDTWVSIHDPLSIITIYKTQFLNLNQQEILNLSLGYVLILITSCCQTEPVLKRLKPNSFNVFTVAGQAQIITEALKKNQKIM